MSLSWKLATGRGHQAGSWLTAGLGLEVPFLVSSLHCCFCIGFQPYYSLGSFTVSTLHYAETRKVTGGGGNSSAECNVLIDWSKMVSALCQNLGCGFVCGKDQAEQTRIPCMY